MNECGYDTDRIGFPGVLGCQAYAFSTATAMYGLHYTGGSDMGAAFQRRIPAFAKFVLEHGVPGKKFVHACGVTSARGRGYHPDRRREQWEAEIKAVGNAIGYSGPISILNTDTMINWFKWTTTYIEFRLIGDKLGLWLQEWHDESKKECPVTTTESTNHKYIGAGTVDDVAATIQDPDKTNLVQYPLKPLD